MTVKGIPEFRRKMRMMPEIIQQEVGRRMEDSANLIAGTMHRAAPDDPATGGDDLRNSIRWEWGALDATGSSGRRIGYLLRIVIRAGGTPGTRREVRKGSGVFTDTARLQEFGTKRHPANPFFFPVWRASRRLVRSRIQAGVRAAVRKINAM